MSSDSNTDHVDSAGHQASVVTREQLHTRNIEMKGFRRSDGLFEIEGQVCDRKPYDFRPPGDWKTFSAHDPIHDMGIRLVFDESLLVVEVHTFTSSAPYPPCPRGGESLQALVGLRMGGGWNKEVRSRLAGASSCTHLVELLGPMATAAFQSMASVNAGKPDRLKANGQPVQIDSCYAYAAEREVVLKRWPQFHRTRGDAQ